MRAAIARAYLGARRTPAKLGNVTLHAHQRVAADALRALLDSWGAALLADDVGLGKTFVACALAREARHTLIVAPAALRTMWLRALGATEVAADCVSYESLSRGAAPAPRPELLILDEAHHARTPTTRRYAQLAALAAGARLLLVSATPLHNRRRDVTALFALALGARADRLDDATLGGLIVRRERCDIASAAAVPAIADVMRVPVADDERIVEAILALPAPLPPSDGGDGGALLRLGLLRQWGSSRGALVGALRRRLARASALTAALESGRYPTRAELSAWSIGDDGVQLAFPELLPPAPRDVADLLASARGHAESTGALLERLRRLPDLDAERAERLREIRDAHPGEKIVAFTQYGETVRSLFRHLRSEPSVAALGARGAAIAGGAISRRDALERFAPLASGVRPPRAVERIDVLLATDLLSEGVNLQDASVVVHLDLPWTPARLEQRVGRSRRLGARHARTAVYALTPPAASEAALRLEARLRSKLGLVRATVGLTDDPLPAECTGQTARPVTLPRRALALDVIARWAESAPPGDPVLSNEFVHIAAVRAERRGAIVLAEWGAQRLLAAFDAQYPSATAQRVEEMILAAADALEAPVPPGRLAESMRAAAQWTERQAAAVGGDRAATVAATARGAVLRRIARAVARAPLHRRAAVAALAARARRAAGDCYGVAAEARLAELAGSDLDDESWLAAVSTFSAEHATPCARGAWAARPELRALLLLIDE